MNGNNQQFTVGVQQPHRGDHQMKDIHFDDATRKNCAAVYTTEHGDCPGGVILLYTKEGKAIHALVYHLSGDQYSPVTDRISKLLRENTDPSTTLCYAYLIGVGPCSAISEELTDKFRKWAKYNTDRVRLIGADNSKRSVDIGTIAVDPNRPPSELQSETIFSETLKLPDEHHAGLIADFPQRKRSTTERATEIVKPSDDNYAQTLAMASKLDKLKRSLNTEKLSLKYHGFFFKTHFITRKQRKETFIKSLTEAFILSLNPENSQKVATMLNHLTQENRPKHYFDFSSPSSGLFFSSRTNRLFKEVKDVIQSNVHRSCHNKHRP